MHKTSTYKETLIYLYKQLPQFQRVGKSAFKPGLGNTRALCKALGNPEQKFRSIHIAGTNGKGSVSSMLASILSESGFKTGLFTSPHFKDFTERMRIDGKDCPQDYVVEFVRKYKHIIEAIRPSFFELTTVMAFDYFAQSKVDIAVLETGLGGRFDSTNVVTPACSVITHISFDHQTWLGDSLPKIAFEKAGIIKDGVPVVISEKHPETMQVFIDIAREQAAPIYFAEDEFMLKRIHADLNGQVFQLEGEKAPMTLRLAGAYQQKNLGAVLETVRILRKQNWHITDDSLSHGLENVVQNSGIRGRMEKIGDSPLILCDVAHNGSGVQAVLDQINSIAHNKFHIVWGMVSDKDHNEILQLLPKNALYYFVKPRLPRGLSASILRKKAARIGLKGIGYPSVRAGLNAAKASASDNDLIFIGGSTFVVAEILP